MSALVYGLDAPKGETAAQRRGISWPEITIVVFVFAQKLPKGVLYAAAGYLLLLAAIVWLSTRERFDRRLLQLIAPIGIVICIGLLSGPGPGLFVYLKDAWYVSTPLVLLCGGYVLFKANPDVAAGLRAFVVAGTLSGVLHLSQFVLHPELLKLDAATLRTEIGFGPSAAALALTILLSYAGRWRSGLRLPTFLAVGCIGTCVLAILFSFSRQLLLFSMIGALAAFGYFSRGELVRVGLAVLLAVVAVAGVRSVVDPNLAANEGTVLGKIARIPDELAIRDYLDRYTIQKHWRGYETSRTLVTYLRGSPVHLLIGRGFGVPVDLGLPIDLATQEGGERVPTRFAPILHNGYAYLLVKAGPLAVLCIAFTLGSLYLIGRRAARPETGGALMPAARTLQGMTLVLVMTTWISMGFLAGGAFVLACGYVVAALGPNRGSHGRGVAS